MKKRFILIIIPALTFSLMACTQGSNKKDEVVQEKNQNKEQETTKEEMVDTTQSSDETNKKMDELAFLEYELDVDYKDRNHDFDVELRKESDGLVKAEYEDKKNNVKKTGEEAFNHIFPKLKDMKIDEKMSKEDVRTKVLKSFDLSDDYIEFDLEITFKNGTKREYDDKK